MSSSWSIIIVTGANGGVGFGICRRLLVQLSQSQPSDALPQFRSTFTSAEKEQQAEASPCDGLTLIMACRSTQRAEAARTRLLRYLDECIEKQRKVAGYDGHADTFRRNLRIVVHYLDLASMTTVFRFAAEIRQKYPYISHLICNAGVASFSGMNWPVCFAQILRGPIHALTFPEYYLQRQGEKSVDGLGWVWQCNLFGHYCLFRSLQLLMSNSKSPLGSRVIWMSSLEASPKFYDSEDWQLVKTESSYQAAKYQIDLIGTTLDRRARKEADQSKQTRHFVMQPGIVSTNISSPLVTGVLDMLKVLVFYLLRALGSPHHTIATYTAAVAAVHLSLASLAVIPTFFSFTSMRNGKSSWQGTTEDDPDSVPVRFSSEADRWGRGRVGVTPVNQWKDHETEGQDLLAKCEELFQRLSQEEARSAPSFERAAEQM